MTPRAYFFLALVVAFHGTAAGALPAKYVETEIDNSQTCTYAVKWDAAKSPQRPELFGSSAQTPITWLNFLSERQLLGYDPLFRPGPVSFAYNGRPLVRDRNLNLQILRDDGTWQTVALFAVAKESFARQGISWTTSSQWPGSPVFGSGPGQEERVVFDRDCHGYMVVNAYRSSLGFAFLLHSPDGGHSWAAYRLPGWSGDGGVRMELPSNPQHVLSRPPVIILHQHLPAPGSPNRAVLLFPEKRIDGTLDIVNPSAPNTHVTVENTICCGDHSGNMTHVVSDGDWVHFAYPSSVPLLTNGRWGTSQHVVTFRRSTRAVESGPTYIGTGFNGPASADSGSSTEPNPHNQPALAIGSDGFLHVVIGGHGAEMKYRKSSAPHVTSSWGAAEEVGLAPDSYTYPALIIDRHNQPHVVSRWSDPGYRFVLVHRMRSASTGAWSAQKVLLDPGRQYYGVWHHKVGIDPWNRMFVSYSYTTGNLWADEASDFASAWGFTLTKLDPTCPNYNVSQQNQPGARYCEYGGYTDVSPGVLVSIDSGASFRLGTTGEFFKGVPASPVDAPTDTKAAIKMLLLDN
jgi:hypothetical protein